MCSVVIFTFIIIIWRVHMFRVIVAGSREFTNYTLLKNRCDFLLSQRQDVVIVSGCARGADTLGERYAKERGYPIAKYPADWDTHGKKAGPIRNEQMAKNADALIAFPIGRSPGTRNMITQARRHNLLVKYGTNPNQKEAI
jgi:hypothetical protein